MTTEESLRLYGLVPSDDSLPMIRGELSNQAVLERTGQTREDDLALLCCVQLFSRGLLEDVLLIWEAKNSGMDLGCLLDIQFLCGAGLETTKRFLAEHKAAEAGQALTRLEELEKWGEFEGFSPDKYLESYREYFGSV